MVRVRDWVGVELGLGATVGVGGLGFEWVYGEITFSLPIIKSCLKIVS